MFKKKKKYIAVFLIKENNSYTVDKIKKFRDISITTINYSKDKSIPINTNNNTFSKGLTSYFFLSITEKKQLFFENTKNLILSTKAIDLVLNDDIIEQLASNLNPNTFKANIIQIIFGGLFGGMVGFIIGGYIP